VLRDLMSQGMRRRVSKEKRERERGKREEVG
jgi:hypothetical protein